MLVASEAAYDLLLLRDDSAIGQLHTLAFFIFHMLLVTSIIDAVVNDEDNKVEDQWVEGA